MNLYHLSPRQSESVCTSHHLNYPLDEAESPPVISLGPLASCGRLEVRRTNLYIINLETQHRRETVTEEVLSSHSLPCSSGELERQEKLSTALSANPNNFRCFTNSDCFDTCDCRILCLCSIHFNLDQHVQI